MIELISEDRCIGCGICVSVCPTDVFEQVEDETPVISRKSDCQTCFMCEAYCPVDAMYVSPNAEENVSIVESELVEQNLLGSYRQGIGWGKGRKSTASEDDSFRVIPMMHRS
ncbi:4Fe-4S binding protein [Bacillus sp. SD075]|uniref:4Fe-4S binding protein n=1 Tax=Bacillus sp. SD075 TaxID=2781732 RepID=UPI001A958CA9|nr:4Fe-4S binding protein [Bacillus sp. SD075]MBO1000677.1 4Fe-4S binding protein [Bacillus sp. SD075]